MKANSFDRKFDQGKGVSKDIDLSKARRPLQRQKRVNVDFPAWMIHSQDRETRRADVTR